ncbi:MAG: hypothetical protein JST59_15140 [Actinobacteria bacterium]|nr:hypothetical protein [Actinomycetota bacterium]
MSGEVELSPRSIEALATRLAALLGENHGGAGRRDEGEMITAAEVARRWRVSRRWVYEHARELGALHIGAGPRPRLRFDPIEVAGRLGAPVIARSPGRPDARRSAGSAERRGSDSLSPPTGAIFVESQIAAGGRTNAPRPAPKEVLRRAPKPNRGARHLPPPRHRRPGGGAR